MLHGSGHSPDGSLAGFHFVWSYISHDDQLENHSLFWHLGLYGEVMSPRQNASLPRILIPIWKYISALMRLTVLMAAIILAVAFHVKTVRISFGGHNLRRIFTVRFQCTLQWMDDVILRLSDVDLLYVWHCCMLRFQFSDGWSRFASFKYRDWWHKRAWRR